MINLKITGQCSNHECSHDLHLLPSDAVTGAYETECAGCGVVYQCVVLSPDELAWHDMQVVKAVTPEVAKK